MTLYRQFMRGLSTSRLHSIVMLYLRFQRGSAFSPCTQHNLPPELVCKPLCCSAEAYICLRVIVFAERLAICTQNTLFFLQHTQDFADRTILSANSQNISLSKDCCLIANGKEDINEHQFFRSKQSF